MTFDRDLTSYFESLLNSKVKTLIESVMLQEAASLLSEADPKPRVELDHENNPVIPSGAQYAQYFMAMAEAHIQDQLKSARTRWQSAEQHAHATNAAAIGSKDAAIKQKAKVAAAQLRAIGLEVRAAHAALKKKNALDKVTKRKTDVKQKASHKHVSGLVKQTTRGMSPMAKMLAQHFAKRLTRDQA